MKYAVINQDSIVVDVINWKGDSFTPPIGHFIMMVNDKVAVNDIYDPVNNCFDKPEDDSVLPQEPDEDN